MEKAHENGADRRRWRRLRRFCDTAVATTRRLNRKDDTMLDDNKWAQGTMTIYGKRQTRLEWLMDLKAFTYLVGPKPKNNPNNVDERRLYHFIQRNKSHEGQIDFESREQLRICAM